MMIDHDAVGAHGTGKPNGSKIVSSAIESEKNSCIGVLRYGSLWYAVPLVLRRNYNPEILITDRLEEKGHLRRRRNSVAVIVGNHNYFVSLCHVPGQQAGALGHAANTQVFGEILEFSANITAINVAVLQKDVYYIRNSCRNAVVQDLPALSDEAVLSHGDLYTDF